MLKTVKASLFIYHISYTVVIQSALQEVKSSKQ